MLYFWAQTPQSTTHYQATHARGTLVSWAKIGSGESWMVKYQQKCTTNTQVHPKLNHQPTMPVRSVHGSWRQEDQEFKTSLDDLRYYPTHSWDEWPIKSPTHLLPTVCFIIPSASWDWDYDITIYWKVKYNQKQG